LIALLALTLLASCASVLTGSSQTIFITTPPTTGANCVLTNRQGTWTVSSPGSVTVKKSMQNIVVTCTKEGWQEGFAAIPANYEDSTSGNIIAGGIIGLGVDLSTGAVNKYPKAFEVHMMPLPGMPQASAE
jgi:hypothetical protein